MIIGKMMVNLYSFVICVLCRLYSSHKKKDKSHYAMLSNMMTTLGVMHASNSMSLGFYIHFIAMKYRYYMVAKHSLSKG